MQVSIIIPVYNVETYIEKCLQSVANQTFNGEMECLIIDDCGQDNSMNIVEKFIQAYNTTTHTNPIEFRILHHSHNRGLSAARNTGLDNAIGDWIYFIDSDDWITPECIELMYECVKKKPSLQMIMGYINYVGESPGWKFAPPGIYKDGIIKLSCSYQIYSMAWNKLLLKKFLIEHKLYFKEGILNEDELWFIQVACFISEIQIIEQSTYYYVLNRNNSIINIQTDISKYINMSHVKYYLIDFIFEYKLDTNTTLYDYVTKDIFEYIILVHKKGFKDMAHNLYKKFRAKPYWSLKFIYKHHKNMREILYALHKYIPYNLGFRYIYIINKCLS